MNVSHFKTFLDLVETRSFSKAAKLNGISQSAVSQQLRALERYLNVQILDRGERRFLLTPAGGAVHEAAKKILHIYSDLMNEIQEGRNLLGGTVRISTLHSIGFYDLPPVLRAMFVEHPNVNFRIEYRPPEVVIEDIARNEADLGLLVNPDAGIKRKFVVIPFATDKLVLVCSPRHHLATAQSVEVSKLVGERFICFDCAIPTHKLIEQVFKSRKVGVKNVMESDNIETIKSACEANIGLALLPSASVEQEVRQGTLVKIEMAECHIKRSLVVVHRKEASLSLAMKKFIEFMSIFRRPEPVEGPPVEPEIV